MRADMFKVIVERPRWGRRHAKSAKLKGKHLEDIKSIGLKRNNLITARRCKALNENLAPLVRFLRSRRGMKWDDVFSEICANLDSDSTVKQHVRDHLADFVLHPITIGRNGEWMARGRPVARFDPWRRRHPFYVDPEDGRLKDHADLAKRFGLDEKGRAA